jgi:N-acetylmuramoyl-L-alanine amidase
MPERLTDLGTIVIDPGHGGSRNVPGSSANNAVSVSGTPEKQLTLAFALDLKAELAAQAEAAAQRINVVLTRSADVNVTGTKRAGAAAKHGAAAFLSIHFNGSSRSNVRGPEFFYRSAENGNANLAADVAFARAVHAGLVLGLSAVGLGGKDRGVRPDTLTALGALGVLSDARLGGACCAALCEIEFITNPEVDRLLVSGPSAAANRRLVARDMATAIRRYLTPGHSH